MGDGGEHEPRLMEDPKEPEAGVTLEDYVGCLLDAKKTDSPEFKALLGVYGRKRLEEIWRSWRGQRKE